MKSDMEIKSETIRKVAYPALAMVAAAALNSCDREGGGFLQATGGIQPSHAPAPEDEPQPLPGDVPMMVPVEPTPTEPTPPEPEPDQGLPGEPMEMPRGE